MGKWLDLAAQLDADVGRDNRDVRDNSAPNVPNVPNVLTALPSEIRAGLFQLESMAAPRLISPECWPAVVSDALRIARDGWATKSLAMAWTPLDLFGAVIDHHGDPHGDGLAAWLGGRRILLLDEQTCIADAGAGARAVFTRRASIGTVLLWDISSQKDGR